MKLHFCIILLSTNSSFAEKRIQKFLYDDDLRLTQIEEKDVSEQILLRGIYVPDDRTNLGQTKWGRPVFDFSFSSSPILETLPIGTQAGILDNITTSDGFLISQDNFLRSFNLEFLTLQTTTSLDYETQSSYLVSFTIEDIFGESLTKDFTIQVLDDRKEDADGDGIPEDVEEDHLGSSDLVIDSDHDGFSDLDEALAGASPILVSESPEIRVTDIIRSPTLGNNGFGWSIAVSDNHIASSSLEPHLVHLLAKDSRDLIYTFTAPVGSDDFGERVFLTNDFLLVSFKKTSTTEYETLQYFRLDDFSTSHQVDLVNSNGQPIQNLALTCNQDVLIVGGQDEDLGGSATSGKIYIFENSSGDQLGELSLLDFPQTLDGLIQPQGFGRSVSLFESDLLVGARGSAYHFDLGSSPYALIGVYGDGSNLSYGTAALLGKAGGNQFAALTYSSGQDDFVEIIEFEIPESFPRVAQLSDPELPVETNPFRGAREHRLYKGAFIAGHPSRQYQGISFSGYVVAAHVFSNQLQAPIVARPHKFQNFTGFSTAVDREFFYFSAPGYGINHLESVGAIFVTSSSAPKDFAGWLKSQEFKAILREAEPIGSNNSIERLYAFQSSPSVINTPFFKVDSNVHSPKIQILFPYPLPPDVEYVLETSVGLGSDDWTPLTGAITDEIDSVECCDEMHTIEVSNGFRSLLLPEPPQAAHRFYRLRAEID